MKLLIFGLRSQFLFVYSRVTLQYCGFGWLRLAADHR